MKKLFALTMALLLAGLALLLPGCSTPKVAVTVGGEQYSTGEYYAYVFNAFYNYYVSQQLYYYEQQGEDVWAGKPYVFGEGDAAREVGLADYLHLLAQDNVKRQTAVERLMKQHGVELSQEERDTLASRQASLKKNVFLQYGFNNDSYMRVTRQTEFNEWRLFLELFCPQDGKDSIMGVKESEVREHFEKNILSYKQIELTLPTAAEGEELTDEQQEQAASFRARMAEYLELFEANGDFDAVITQFNIDEEVRKAEEEAAAAEDEYDDEEEPDDTDDGSETTTTTTTTTTTATTSTTEPTTSATEPTEETEPEEELPTPADENRYDVDASREGAMDANLLAALRDIPMGEARVVEYEKGAAKAAEGETVEQKPNTIALVLRMDPEADRGKDADGNPVDYYKQQHDAVAASLKYEEFDKLVKDEMDKLEMTVNQKAVEACDPKSFKAYFGL